MRWDFFWKPESNRVHPSTLESRSATLELPDDITNIADALTAAYALGLPFGSPRTGVHEAHSDEGIYFREGRNKRAATTFTFKSWEQLDLED